jgi:hypothetical protein
MKKQLSEKDQYLLDLWGEITDLKDIERYKEGWSSTSVPEFEEMLDNPEWKKHYPKLTRDEVRASLKQDGLDAVGRLESALKADEITEMVSA